MVEVDFLPASHEKKSGDCILMRTGSFSYDPTKKNNQTVIMIDSGFADCSNDVKKYLKEWYRTSRIDHVFITHPDLDHISGLNALLDDTDVQIDEIIIHDPWNHVNEVFKKTEDGRRTRKSIAGKFEDTLKTLDSVFDKIAKRRIPTQEAFAGYVLNLGEYELKILGPDKKYYESVLTQFPGMENESSKSDSSVYENLPTDCLFVDNFFFRNPVTSAKNNSSMVALLSKKERSMNSETIIKKPLFLFTGDAGTEALRNALLYAKTTNVPVKGCRYVQLPHHGSLKNVDEDFFDYIEAGKYIVSASSTDVEHPSRLLVNYIVDNHAKDLFHVSDNGGLRCNFDSPGRPGWSTAKPKQMFNKVYKIKGGL